MKNSFVTVFCTVPDAKTGRKIAKALVKSRLAACVNIISGINSIYIWDGKLCDDAENLLVIKTRGSLFGELAEKIKQNHPYATPEIICLPIINGNKEYLKWLAHNT
ncbi:MAG: divalent-cation tolerance protein CutA [Planctomycetes bacterium]|nr:divalent-cation tolerance protein CutA [Planctomycetota bacterium]